MFADVYFALGASGQDVAAARNLEVWQVAAALGVDYERQPPPEDPAPGVRSGRGPSDLLRQRVAWQKGQGPRPDVGASGREAAIHRM